MGELYHSREFSGFFSFVLSGLGIQRGYRTFPPGSLFGVMAALLELSEFLGPRCTSPLVKEERQDLWIETLIRGLTDVARNVPEARVAVYQLLADLCFAERR